MIFFFLQLLCCRFNEDCQFTNCNYREHQTHFHCMRKDCNYRFCDKTRYSFYGEKRGFFKFLSFKFKFKIVLFSRILFIFFARADSCNTQRGTSAWTPCAAKSFRAFAASPAAAKIASSTPYTTQVGLSQVCLFISSFWL